MKIALVQIYLVQNILKFKLHTMKQFKFLIPVLVLFLLSSCAMYYRPIAPEKTNYNIQNQYDGLEVSLRYDMLQFRGNKKMSKKEQRGSVKIIAVKLINTSDTTINIGRDYAFYSDGVPINLLDPTIVKDHVKQSVIGYAPYFLGCLGGTTITVNERVESNFPYNKIIFSAIAIGNMLTANIANIDLLKELTKYDIRNIDIKPGETVFGIIGINDYDFKPITVKKIRY